MKTFFFFLIEEDLEPCAVGDNTEARTLSDTHTHTHLYKGFIPSAPHVALRKITRMEKDVSKTPQLTGD